MALIEMNVHSQQLEQTTQIAVIYPDEITSLNPNVLFLYHGYSGSYLDYVRYTNIEKLATLHNVVVVLPSANNSFYTNMITGANYYNYFQEELLSIISKYFKIKLSKENTYIAGLSMGGYGALKMALTEPKKYKGVASFSGALNIKEIYNKGILNPKVLKGIFGDLDQFNQDINLHDLNYLVNNIKSSDLKIYLSCGNEDSLLEMTKEFSNHLNNKSIEHQLSISNGNHEWKYWNTEVETVLNYFFKD